MNVDIFINASSNEVSFKSAIVVARFANVPPPPKEWSVAISVEPSPPVVENALFNTAAALICLVFAIDLARALVYLAPSLSYKLSSTASSVRAKANATVSCV